jgi:hypothetical protein
MSILKIISEIYIYIPSQSEDRDEDDMVGLYGFNYSEFTRRYKHKFSLYLICIMNRMSNIEGEFSGEY